MAAAKKGPRILSALLQVAVVGGFIYFAMRWEGERARQQQEADRTEQAARAAVFARGELGEMLALCREGWTGRFSFHHEPVALAFTRQGIDAYFLQGTDETSLRLVRCDAEGVSRGPRVEHPLLEKLPAEAKAEPDDRIGSEWTAALARTAERRLGPGDVAFELMRHPFTGAAVSRHWQAGPEGATATLDPPEAAPFAFLAGASAFPVVGKPPAALRSLPRKRWIAQPGEAFALLSRELPKGARVSELRLGEDRIEVYIEWQTPAFDGKPPAPYGDKSFDEYGVADLDWWYPREIPGFGCAAGAPLAEVIQAFGVAQAQRSRPTTEAWFSCSTAYSNGRSGTWHLMPDGS
jgi:hypothetical protein